MEQVKLKFNKCLDIIKQNKKSYPPHIVIEEEEEEELEECEYCNKMFYSFNINHNSDDQYLCNKCV